jgi:pimeloyl-ACP methyl ester carboxylesterase
VTGPESIVPDALFHDPPTDRAAPAQTLPVAIPSHGVNLNAVLYIAAGAGPHATILLLHGLPGNEQNIDLAQAMRRAGWNVLTIHYRGSWGSPGAFSFAHCLEDAASALDWLRSAGEDDASRVNPKRIVVIGHSMGGFVAVHLLAEQPDILGAVLISGVDLGNSFGSEDKRRAAAEIDENVGSSAGLHILAGTSPLALADEARANAEQWSLRNYAVRIAGRPLLLATADDGFAADIDALADALRRTAQDVLVRHFSTDHSYSDCRIGLQTIVLRWLAATCGSG